MSGTSSPRTTSWCSRGWVDRMLDSTAGSPIIERLAEKYQTPIEALAYAEDLAASEGP